VTKSIISVACAILLSALAHSAHAEKAKKPNILLILVDDVGREVLGCYGGESYKTPNIDRLAAAGTRFEHAYVMPMCHPTRLCLMTGHYPFRLGPPRWGTFPKSAEKHTLANVLKPAGYATGIAGKWQFTLLKDNLEQPNRMGFDEYCLDAWHEGPWYYQPRIWQDGRLREDVHDRYGPDVTCEYLIDFIRRHRDEPFFAYYTMELCHDETNDLDKPAPYGPLGRYENYPEMVAQMDKRVGRVMAALDSLDLRNRTLVLFLSDNGTPPQNLERFANGKYVFKTFTSKFHGRPVRGGKGQLADWGIRVPMIVSWLGEIRANTTSDALVDGSDILPTLAQIAGAKLPSGVRLDGHSIAAVLRGSATKRQWIFAEYNGLACIRNRRWKLYSDGRFYDMDADPDEKASIAKSSLVGGSLAAFQSLHQQFDDLGFENAGRTQ
jgi:arylsulfatase A